MMSGLERRKQMDIFPDEAEEQDEELPKNYITEDVRMRLNTMTEKMRNIMKVKGYKQDYFQSRCGIGQTDFSRYQNGHRIPKLDRFLMIANELGLTPNELLGYTAPVTAVKRGYVDGELDKILSGCSRSEVEKLRHIVKIALSEIRDSVHTDQAQKH